MQLNSKVYNNKTHSYSKLGINLIDLILKTIVRKSVDIPA